MPKDDPVALSNAVLSVPPLPSGISPDALNSSAPPLPPPPQQFVAVDPSAASRSARFSWTPEYEQTFFRSLCESVRLGLREHNTFKPEAWDRALGSLRDLHGARAAKSHLVNKADNARKRFRVWRSLKEDPKFLFNPVSKCVIASDEAWDERINKEPHTRSLRGRPFDYEEYMEILYPDVIGSKGAPRRITRPRKKQAAATPVTTAAVTSAADDVEAVKAAAATAQSIPPPIESAVSDAEMFSLTGAEMPSFHPTIPPQPLRDSQVPLPPHLPIEELPRPPHRFLPRSSQPHHSSRPDPAAVAPVPLPQPQILQQQQQQQQIQPTSISQIVPGSRPTSAVMPPQTNLQVSASALTPPEETAPRSRKRGPSIPDAECGPPFRSTFYQDHAVRTQGYVTQTSPATPDSATTPTAPPPEKRRRGGGGHAAAAAAAAVGAAANGHGNYPAAYATAVAATAAAAVVAAAPAHHNGHGAKTGGVGYGGGGEASVGMANVAERMLLEHGALLERVLGAVQAQAPPRWSEQAMDIFLRDFSSEDFDFQVKVAEKVLADESKAMVFCKFSPALREHWVKRLREISSNSSSNSNNSHNSRQ